MVKLASPADIQTSIRRIARRISAPPALLPETVPSAWGAPHIEVDRLYHFVVCERGLELERRSSPALDDLFYWIFQSVTFSMASDCELALRKPHEDSRRQLFTRQLDLMNTLNPTWSNRLRDELAEIVAAYPFSDDQGRAERFEKS